MQNLRKIIDNKFLEIFSEFFNHDTTGVKYHQLIQEGYQLDANQRLDSAVCYTTLKNHVDHQSQLVKEFKNLAEQKQDKSKDSIMNHVYYAHIDWTSYIFQGMLANLRELQSVEENVEIRLMTVQANHEIITSMIEQIPGKLKE